MARPAFDDLPLREGDPPFSAWSLYGLNDQLGTLNLLTPEVVTEASKEIKTGVRVGLDAPVDYLARPPHNRQPLKHTIIHKAPRAVHDDLLDFNTQVGRELVPEVFCCVVSHARCRYRASGMDSNILDTKAWGFSITVQGCRSYQVLRQRGS